MRFFDEEKFYSTITQWIRDGSSLKAFSDGGWGLYAELLGRDGCIERFYLYYDEKDYKAPTV